MPLTSSGVTASLGAGGTTPRNTGNSVGGPPPLQRAWSSYGRLTCTTRPVQAVTRVEQGDLGSHPSSPVHVSDAVRPLLLLRVDLHLSRVRSCPNDTVDATEARSAHGVSGGNNATTRQWAITSPHVYLLDVCRVEPPQVFRIPFRSDESHCGFRVRKANCRGSSSRRH